MILAIAFSLNMDILSFGFLKINRVFKLRKKAKLWDLNNDKILIIIMINN